MRTFALVAAAALLLAGGAAAQCPNIPDCNDCATEPTICTTCADGFTAVDVRSLWCVACPWRLQGEGRWRWGWVQRRSMQTRRRARQRRASCWQHRVCAARRAKSAPSLQHTQCSVPNNACLAPGSRCVVDASGNACDETDPRICLACAGGATLTFDGRVRAASGAGCAAVECCSHVTRVLPPPPPDAVPARLPRCPLR